MKRLSAFCASLGLFLMANPMTALAAEQEGGASASSVPLWMCIPFAGLLLCIAILPLVKAEWWEEHMRLLFGQFFLSFRLRCVTVRGQHWKRFWNAWSMTICPLLFCYLDFSALPVISRCPVTWQVLRVSMWDYWHWEPCFQAGSVRLVPVC